MFLLRCAVLRAKMLPYEPKMMLALKLSEPTFLKKSVYKHTKITCNHYHEVFIVYYYHLYYKPYTELYVELTFVILGDLQTTSRDWQPYTQFMVSLWN